MYKFLPNSFFKLIITIFSLVIFIGMQNIKSFAATTNSIEAPIKIRINGDPTTLDWNKQLDVHSERVSYQIMEGLVSLDNKNKINPALATSWTLSPDRLTLTFKLRKGVIWSDGVALNAQQFVDSFERVLNPKTAAPGSSLVYEINGAEAYNKGLNADPKTLGFYAKDDLTLVVKLKRPADYFVPTFDHPITFPIRKDLIEKYGDQWTKAENLVTLGAYKLKNWQVGKSVDMVANEKYYGRKPFYKELSFLVVTDDMTALNLYEKSEVDMVVGLPALELGRLQKMKGYQVYDYIYNNYIGFNPAVAPFQDARVRKAFVQATNVEQVAEILGGGKTPSHSWIPKGIMGYNQKIGLTYDVKLAKKLLAEAGFPEGKGFPKVTFVVNTSDENKLMAERLQNMWKENLGVQVDLELETWKTYLGRLRTNPPALFRLGFSMVYSDPNLFANIFTTGAQLNYIKWSNKKYDSLVDQAAVENSKNIKTRSKLYDQAQTILLRDEAAIMPLYQSGLPLLVSDRINNLTLNGRTKFLVRDVTQKKGN